MPRQTSPSRTPKGVNHGHPSFSPANQALLGVHERGPQWRSRTPLAGTLFAASPVVVVGEGHAPVAAVLVPAVKKKRKGATRPIADPSAWHPSAASPVVVVGEGHAPVVAVLVAAVK